MLYLQEDHFLAEPIASTVKAFASKTHVLGHQQIPRVIGKLHQETPQKAQAGQLDVLKRWIMSTLLSNLVILLPAGSAIWVFPFSCHLNLGTAWRRRTDWRRPGWEVRECRKHSSPSGVYGLHFIERQLTKSKGSMGGKGFLVGIFIRRSNSFHWFHPPNHSKSYISFKLQVFLRLNIQRTAAELSNHHRQLFLITSPLRSNLQDSLVKRISAEITSRKTQVLRRRKKNIYMYIYIYGRNWKVISSNTFTKYKQGLSVLLRLRTRTLEFKLPSNGTCGISSVYFLHGMKFTFHYTFIFIRYTHPDQLPSFVHMFY